MRGATQGRTIPSMSLINLVPVFQLRQPLLHILKFGSVHLVFRLGRQQRVDLFLGLGNAVGSLGMSIESLGQRTRLVFFQRFDLFEK